MVKYLINKDSADELMFKIIVHDDEKAFHDLFYDFFSPLCVFSQRFIEDEDVCEDIVQEVFYKIWKNRKNININISTRSFLIKSVKNSCLDYIRHLSIERKYIEEYLFETDNSFEDNLYTTAELESIINNALEKLPSKIKEIFLLNRFEGKTYNEIAEIKQISIKTVEANMTKALKFLRLELKDYLFLLLVFLY